MAKPPQKKPGPPLGQSPANPPSATPPLLSGPEATRLLLAFLASVHGPSRQDEKGDYYYDNVSSISLHLLLGAGLPGPPLLWAWYGYFDQQLAESIYQTLPPRRDHELLEVLGRSGLEIDLALVENSGLLVLPHHQSQVFSMVADFVQMRLESYLTLPDPALRQLLTPRQSWTDRLLAQLVGRIQTQPLEMEQRQAVYREFSTGYLKATARHLMDEATLAAFWKQPPPEMEPVEERLIAFAREMNLRARQLGVYVSQADYQEAQRRRLEEELRRGFGGKASDGRWGAPPHAPSPRRGDGRAQLALLGLKPGASLAQVKTAYREQVKRHHPDQGGTVQAFLKLQEAYEYLLERVYGPQRPKNR